VREGLEMSYLTAKGEPLRKDEKETLIRDMSPVSSNSAMNALKLGFENGNGFTHSCEKNNSKAEVKFKFQTKDLSRLWGYRNGQSPKISEDDIGITRMATI
jgi:hypothetical protein